MNGRVLVLDGRQRSALAVTRSLGKRRIRVVVADSIKSNLSSNSRFCESNFAYPSVMEHPDEFIPSVAREIERKRISVVFPMSDLTTHLVLRNREFLPPVVIPFAGFESYEALTNKVSLFRLAQELKIPFPHSHLIENRSYVESVRGHLRYPAVLKPFRSKIFTNGKCVSTEVRYAYTWEELVGIVSKFDDFLYPFLIQEKIQGEGLGVFCLYDRGKCIVTFAHKRLRERPPSGGVSVLRESVPVDPYLEILSRRLLDKVGWHGVAMVEYKMSSDRKPYLMEVNARFWGSLQLAIDAGVDFPYLLYCMALEKELDPVEPYKCGVRSRWLLGDLDHLYLRLFQGRDLPSNYPSRLKCIADFLAFGAKDAKLEVFSTSDLKPFLLELGNYLLRR